MYRLILAAALTGVLLNAAFGQTSTFTYQGQLKDDGVPANGSYDLVFKLFNAASGGAQVGSTNTKNGVVLTNGLFNQTLDFGATAFTGDRRWIEIAANGTLLSPRQEITAVPYALSVPGLSTSESGVEVAGDIHTPGDVIAGAFSSNSPLIFKVNPGNVECARFDDANCFLGLGTTDPQARLHIGGVAGVDGIRFPDGSLQTSAAGIGGGDGFWSLSGANIYNNNGGNVGIGTPTPTESFHLVGNPFRQVVARFDNPGAGTGGCWLTTAHTPTGREWSFGTNALDGGFDFFNNFSFISVMRISQTGDIFAHGNLTVAGGTNPPNYRTHFNYSGDGRNYIRGATIIADTGGDVGIGTASPVRRLHTLDPSIFSSRFETSHATAAVAEFRSAASNNTWEYGVAGSAPPFGLGAGDLYMYRQGNGEPGLTISSNNFTSSLRCADFKIGHPSRRGSPGRALVDNGDHLVVNFASDWGYTYVHGRLKTNILEITGADLSEKFPSDERNVDPGTVMEIDPANTGKLRVASEAYSPRVAGVVSGAGDVPVGAVLGNLPGRDDGPAVALSGRVWVHCDASNGAIVAGDLLTTSSTPGHAMKAADRERSHGTVLGKAMTSLPQGERGLVLVLVNLQ